MRRILICGIAIVTLGSVSAVRAADVHVQVVIPPPPQIVFEAQPDVVVVPQTRVEYVPAVTDYDMYRYGKYWYVNQSGYWYRSRSYRGPFKYVSARYLPHAVMVVPADYGHHPRKPPKHKPAKHKKHHRHY